LCHVAFITILQSAILLILGLLLGVDRHPRVS
jgi:hypothetical protein